MTTENDQVEVVGGRLDQLLAPVQALIERRPTLILSLLFLQYLLFALPIASLNTIWFDETVSYWTGSMPSVGAIWQVLKERPMSTDPPLFHILNHFVLAMFGSTPLVLRLVPILGGLLIIYGVFQFVAARFGVAAAAIVIQVYISSSPFHFAAEMRPYSLLWGLFACAFLVWAQDERLPWSIGRTCLFALLIVGCALSHFYAPFLLLALGAGEIVRLFVTRKFNRGAWLGLLCGALAIVSYVPLLKAASQYRSSVWKTLFISDLLNVYHEVFETSMLFALFAAIVLFSVFYIKRVNESAPAPVPMLSPAEAIVCLTLCLVPVLGFLVAHFVTKVLEPRYVLGFFIGALILIAQGLTLTRPYLRQRICLVLAVAVLASLFFAQNHYRSKRKFAREMSQIMTTFERTPGPIVLTTQEISVVWFNASSGLRRRLYYLADEQLEQKYLHAPVLTVRALRQWTPMQIVDYKDFVCKHNDFWIYDWKAAFQSWLPQKLADDRFPVLSKNTVVEGTYAHLAVPPGACAASSAP